MNGDWDPFKAVYILTFHFNVKFIPYISRPILYLEFIGTYKYFSRGILQKV